MWSAKEEKALTAPPAPALPIVASQIRDANPFTDVVDEQISADERFSANGEVATVPPRWKQRSLKLSLRKLKLEQW